MTTQAINEQLRQGAQDDDLLAQEELGIVLVSGTTCSTEEFSEGLDWLRKADQSGSIRATLALGHVHAQNSSLPDAPAIAYACYAKAARAGNPEAVERLADLFQIAYGTAQDDAKAFSMYEQLCAYGFPRTLCQSAYMLDQGMGCEVDEIRATSLIFQAAIQEDPLAFYLLAVRFEHGVGVGQNQAMAAAWMAQAAATEFPGAKDRLSEMNAATDQSQLKLFASNLDGLFLSLRKAIETLQARMANDDPLYHDARLEIIHTTWEKNADEEISLDPGRRSPPSGPIQLTGPRTTVLGWEPRVFMIEDFASESECAYLIDAAMPIMKTREQSRALGKAMEIDEFEGSRAIFFPHYCNPVIRNLQRRWAGILHINDKHFEPMSVLRYGQGHEYASQVDYFDMPRMLAQAQSGDSGGQRLVTALIYLIAPEAGGATCYEASGVSATGHRGCAIVHYNTTPDGLPDEASVHQGQVIEAGEKWLARTAVREQSLYDQPYKVI